MTMWLDGVECCESCGHPIHRDCGCTCCTAGRKEEGMWTAWHDLDDQPFFEGTETAAKFAALPGSVDGDYVESPDGTQYGLNPVTGEWVES